MKHSTIAAIAGLILLTWPAVLRAQPSTFTYQGSLSENGTPASGRYDLRFTLQDSGSGTVGSSLFQTNVPVSAGLFVATLDFGTTVWNGEARWLEIGVRPGGSAAAFTVLSPRQPITAAPSAIHATVADGLSGPLSESQLPANAARLDASQVFTGANTFGNSSNRFTGGFTGNGGGLTNLPAGQLAGTVPDARLSANVALLNRAQTFSGLATFAPASGAPFAVGNANLVPNLNADLLDGLNASGFWQLRGNAGTTAGTDFLGTTDAQPLELKVNNARALRLEPGDGNPNVLGGISANSALAGVGGGTIAGGGSTALPNSLANDFATVGGGYGNQARGRAATVPGGASNNAEAELSLAAGYRAKARHSGSLVWADALNYDFPSTASNQFRVRSSGGAEFVTRVNATGATLAGVTMTATNGVSIGSAAVTDPALELRQGAIRVPNAHLTGAQTPVFIHHAAAATLVDNCTVIDHPLCNGDRNAVLLVTFNANPGDATGMAPVNNNHAVGVFYTGAQNATFPGALANKWLIYNLDGTPMPLNAAFNVLVVKP
jgi:hypothetical protein